MKEESSDSIRFQTLDEARLIARRLAALTPTPDMVEIGLVELLINAIEHGNLDIDYEEKRRLMLEETFYEEIAYRMSTPPWSLRSARITTARKKHAIVFLVEDEGEGFDWNSVDMRYPRRITDPNGRGIAMARMLSFQQLEYLGRGNQVRATVFISADQHC